MKNKGFTLIELLAVIVILAIIALIATPIILNIIDNTKEESVKRSIDHYMSAATNAIAAANLKDTTNGVMPKNCTINPDGNLVCDGYENPILVEIDGEKPTGGSITFENGKITGLEVTMPDENTYKLDTKGNVVKAGEGSAPGTGEGDGESGEEYIYRTYPNASELNIGDNISGISYETNRPTTPQTAYLMHKVADNVITESYACIVYVENGTRKDACVRGGVANDDDIYNQNKAVIESLIPYYETLTFGDDKGYCTALKCVSDALDIVVSKTGRVYGWFNDITCEVKADGISSCYEEE